MLFSVGYSTIALVKGAMCSGASFKTIAQKGMRLSEIVPTGYDVPTYWCGGKKTGFNNLITIQVLDANGNTAKDFEGNDRYFCFTRAGKSSKWTEEGYWHRFGDDTKITADNDETFKMGEGLRVAVGADAYKQTGATDDTFKLQFPGIDDTYVTEE